VTDKAWLNFPEAITLVAARLNCGSGAAQARANEAIASGEIRCSYATRAVGEQERKAHAELVRQTEQNAATRGLAVSGSVIDIMRAQAQQGAYQRAKSRLALKANLADPTFNADLAAGDIQISKADLLSWVARHCEMSPTNLKIPAPRAAKQHKRMRAKQAIFALWPEGVPPAEILPDGMMCQMVLDWLKTDCEKQKLPWLDISEDTIKRGAERK
jgi:hypothetical protein